VDRAPPAGSWWLRVAWRTPVHGGPDIRRGVTACSETAIGMDDGEQRSSPEDASASADETTTHPNPPGGVRGKALGVGLKA
jgi:hypothetical protein